MKFSVVIPLFNKAQYVAQSLTSVLEQTVQDFEIIVVDDGSTDGGAEVVRGLGDSRIRLLRQENAGVSAARNRGIEAAVGEWVSFLDADDWLHPEFLQRVAEVAGRYPEALFVASDFRTREHTESWPPDPWGLPLDARVEILHDLPRHWIHTSMCMDTVAFRRDLLVALMPCFDPDLCQFEDTDLFFRIAERTPVAYIPLPLACYRIAVPSSLMSRADADDTLRFILRLEARARSAAVRGGQPASMLLHAHRLRILLARDALRRGKRLDALRQLASGWRAMRAGNWWYTLLMFLGAPASPRSRLRRLLWSND